MGVVLRRGYMMTVRQRRNFYLSNEARKGLEEAALNTGCVTSAIGTPSVSLFLEKLGTGEVAPVMVRQAFKAVWDIFDKALEMHGDTLWYDEGTTVHEMLLEVVSQFDSEYANVLAEEFNLN
jgi:hypothetical protein